MYGRSELIGAAFAQTAGYSMLAWASERWCCIRPGPRAPTLQQNVLRSRSLSKMGAYNYGFTSFTCR